MEWYRRSVTESLDALGVNPAEGLPGAEAERRFAQHGPNELAEQEGESLLRLFLGQFNNFLLLLLIAAAVVSGVLAAIGEGDVWDPILIMVIVLFAAVLGFVQEYRSGKALDALRRMAAPTATVLRDGVETTVAARTLVPGDVLLVHAGDRIPADARIVEEAMLRVDEAALTGESLPVGKDAEAIGDDVPLADRRNMLYSGTSAVHGRGVAVVVATGMETEFGRIAGMLQEVETPPTPLQVSLDRTGKILGIACLVVCAFVAAAGLLVGMFGSVVEAFLWGISLAVAAVPEALPAVVTITLAVGVSRMARRHALLRSLPAVETLGCTSYICTDKTGTLTQNEMTVTAIWTGGDFVEVSGVGYAPEGAFTRGGVPVDPASEAGLSRLLTVGILCNDSHLVRDGKAWRVTGDPTEGALVVLAGKAGMTRDGVNDRHPRVDEVPFTSERMRMTTLHAGAGETFGCSKGAPEVILDSCSSMIVAGGDRPLADADREVVLDAARRMAGRALRVLGLAWRPVSDGMTAGEAEEGMVFLGLVGMIDPPRLEVRGAIAECREAGIVPVMITGDHAATAGAVAREIGMLAGDGVLLTHDEVDRLDDGAFAEMVGRARVYARVSPSHKLRVVEALQARGEVVAMTGDGVNDAPALKKADIGVAMGITGTDVSKAASAMVLTDDNFASIVAAVEEGRGIFENIRKFLAYLLSCNVGEVILMLLAFVAGTILGETIIPLVALQVLWVNLVTDGLPALALAVDPSDPDIMKRPPRPRSSGVFSRWTVTFIAGIGLWTAVSTLAVFLWALSSGRPPEQAQCLAFVTLIMVELFNCFNCRSERHSLFVVGPFRNRWLLAAVASSFAVTLPLLYLPFFNEPFHTFPLGALDWVVVTLAGASVLLVVEAAKLVARLAGNRGKAA